jgi:membrane protein YqaA with SNARE-associated domain
MQLPSDIEAEVRRRLADWTARILHRPIPSRLIGCVAPMAARKTFPLWGGVVAFLATLSFTVPVVPLLTALVVVNRRRWAWLVISSAVGSATAGALFVHVLGHYGGAFVAAQIPEIVATSHWQHTALWISTYGMLALAFIAALPIAQTPALILVAILGMPSSEVLVSLLIGKGLKYSTVGAFVARTLDQALPEAADSSRGSATANPQR